MTKGKPQRRTLVKALADLVDHVNGSVFNAMDADEIESGYKGLLLATNEAERVLDRERQHNSAEQKKKGSVSPERTEDSNE